MTLFQRTNFCWIKYCLRAEGFDEPVNKNRNVEGWYENIGKQIYWYGIPFK